MMCTDCDFRCDKWIEMKEHYSKAHPQYVNPGALFTKEAKQS